MDRLTKSGTDHIKAMIRIANMLNNTYMYFRIAMFSNDVQ